MGIMVYSLLWVMQDLDHQPYFSIALSINPSIHLCFFIYLVPTYLSIYLSTEIQGLGSGPASFHSTGWCLGLLLFRPWVLSLWFGRGVEHVMLVGFGLITAIR